MNPMLIPALFPSPDSHGLISRAEEETDGREGQGVMFLFPFLLLVHLLPQAGEASDRGHYG